MNNLQISNDNLKITAGRKLMIMRGIWRVPECELPWPAKAILSLLLDMTDPELRRAWPGAKTISAQLGLSRSTVKDHIKKLATAGWITITPRKSGEGDDDTNLYHVHAWDDEALLVQKARARPLPGFPPYPRESNKGGPHRGRGGGRAADAGGDRGADAGGSLSGPNSSYDSPKHKTSSTHNPERFASGPAAADSESYKGREYLPYQQTKQEAERQYDVLCQMNWRTAGSSSDATFDPTERGAKVGARVTWSKLLRSGISAHQVVAAAELFLNDNVESQRPSLARFLARYAPQCDDPEEGLYVLPPQHPIAA